MDKSPFRGMEVARTYACSTSRDSEAREVSGNATVAIPVPTEAAGKIASDLRKNHVVDSLAFLKTRWVPCDRNQRRVQPTISARHSDHFWQPLKPKIPLVAKSWLPVLELPYEGHNKREQKGWRLALLIVRVKFVADQVPAHFVLVQRGEGDNNDIARTGEFRSAMAACTPLQSGMEISMMMTCGAQSVPTSIASAPPKAIRQSMSSNDKYAANA